MTFHDDVDPDDLPFLPTNERLSALGFDPENTITAAPDEEYASERLIIAKQKPVPGVIEVDLYQISLRRGLVHESGKYKGLVNLSAIQRGTELALTTLIPLFRRPDETVMIHLDTLARLCDFMQMQPGDFLRYKPGVPDTGPALSEQYKKQR